LDTAEQLLEQPGAVVLDPVTATDDWLLVTVALLSVRLPALLMPPPPTVPKPVPANGVFPFCTVRALSLAMTPPGTVTTGPFPPPTHRHPPPRPGPRRGVRSLPPVHPLWQGGKQDIAARLPPFPDPERWVGD